MHRHKALGRVTADPATAPDLPLLAETKKALSKRFSLLLKLGAYYAEQGLAPWVELMELATTRLRILNRPGGGATPSEEDPEASDDTEGDGA